MHSQNPNSMNQLALYIRQSLQDVYPSRELQNISRIVCCELLGRSDMDYYLGKDMILSEKEQAKLESILARLKKNEPLQYVQREAHFFGRVFEVAPGVLIPRPETEELVQLIIEEAAAGSRILDIGTGSGCIAVSLSKELPGAAVTAWDVSVAALDIARANNKKLAARVVFREQDVFSDDVPGGTFDIIVSNPPYVTEREKEDMTPNVLEWEPPLALFVPDDDPLRFYRRIAGLGRRLLAEQGRLYFEINRAYGDETAAMLRRMDYHDVRILKDMSGNNRIVTAIR